ncbi:hypothetical protein ELI55_36890 [Rhizobium ruizarguesonis]|uniref:hypothetical protein n=1 Tax=Rhizobium ruizarguesonis TaxID=2081791 RepID=UPI00103229C8|nr:hypothetical protein [Rhizobium ruizarguesonis]TAT91982.1 hypothetical protein ELI55_36890 [Rhizobium ruizarguesonis]TAZ26635.1 hypothetical protein ELH74_31860 [Rhizobium ruizarguesonis]
MAVRALTGRRSLPTCAFAMRAYYLKETPSGQSAPVTLTRTRAARSAVTPFSFMPTGTAAGSFSTSWGIRGPSIPVPTTRRAGLPPVLPSSARRSDGHADSPWSLSPPPGAAGLFDAPGSGHAGWRLMVVVSTESHDNRHIFVAEAIDRDPVQGAFSYLAADALIAAGDFVSVNGQLISFLHPETLSHVTFKDGGAIEPAMHAPSAGSGPGASRADGYRRQIAAHQESGQGKGRTPRHDRGGDCSFPRSEDQCRAALRSSGPVVKSYALAGTRKPRDVAVRLNKDGHRTAADAHWTPRLVHFLLALIFSDTSGRGGKQAPPSPSPRLQPRVDRKRQPLTQDDIASRLSALGRVTLRRK